MRQRWDRRRPGGASAVGSWGQPALQATGVLICAVALACAAALAATPPGRLAGTAGATAGGTARDATDRPLLRPVATKPPSARPAEEAAASRADAGIPSCSAATPIGRGWRGSADDHAGAPARVPTAAAATGATAGGRTPPRRERRPASPPQTLAGEPQPRVAPALHLCVGDAEAAPVGAAERLRQT